MNFMYYRRKSYTEMREYVPGEKLEGVSITMSDFDKNKGHPKEGDMIARDPDNHADQWLVHKDYFQRHYVDMGHILHNGKMVSRGKTRKMVPKS